jgi:hypothetical protein
MFRFTKKPSSGSHSQYLAKITHLVQCGYIVSVYSVYSGYIVSITAAYYAAVTLTTSVRPLCIHIEPSL